MSDNSIIKLTSLSNAEIKKDLTDYLSTLSNWSQIKSTIPSSNLSVLLDLVAGFTAYITYKQNSSRNEKYLSTSHLESSIFEWARLFGYRLNRYTCPVLSFTYNDSTPITLKRGDILGSYGDYDLFYFGDDLIVLKSDVIELNIGHYRELNYTLSYDETNISELVIIPTFLKSIEDSKVYITRNSVPITTSKMIEDYITLNKVIDYSHNPYISKLMLSDSKYNYGNRELKVNDQLKISFIETNGNIPDLDEKSINDLSDLVIDAKYVITGISHSGTSGQDLDLIRSLVPLYYSTQRRMVTESDHKYICESHPYIKSASAEKDDGKLDKTRITFDVANSLNTYTVTIGNDVITFTYNPLTEVGVNVYTKFYNLVSTSRYVNVDVRTATKIELSNKLTKYIPPITTTSTNVHIIKLQEGIEASSCTTNLYYIRSSSNDSISPLTEYEKIEFSRFLVDLKMVGNRIVLIPASKIDVELSLVITLSDSTLYSKVSADILKIVKTYELKTETEYDTSQLLTEISRINYLNAGATFYPVKKVKLASNYNQSQLVISTGKKSFIKYSAVNISLG